MEGVVAKRTLKKSYYAGKNITNLSLEDIPQVKIKDAKTKEKNKVEKIKEKILFKTAIQSITMISILVFLISIKILNINVVLEADITKKITTYYQKSYSLNQILSSAKNYTLKTYSFLKPIVPNKIENKIKQIYQIIITDKTKNIEQKEQQNQKNDGEVIVYEESSSNSKENTNKENIGVSADVKENDQKTVVVSSSISSEDSILQKIKDTKVKFVKPVVGSITSHFGAREVIFEGIDSYHTGTDIAAKTGTKVVSSIEGKVTRASYNQYNGNFVEVTNGKIATIYCHMSKLSVKVGDNVKSGTKIGEIGSTGLSTGPHLHFEIVYSGTKIDPETVLEL